MEGKDYFDKIIAAVKKITAPFLVRITDKVEVAVSEADPKNPLCLESTIYYKFISKLDGKQYGSYFYIPCENELDDMLSEVTEQVAFLLFSLMASEKALAERGKE